MKPVNNIKSVLTSVNGWIGKKLGVEEDEELLTPEVQARAAAAPASKAPFAPPTNSPASGGMDASIDHDPPTPGNLAGMRKGASDGLPASSAGLVQHGAGDTQYRSRNAIVEQVRHRYSKYGETMAAAMLSRVITPEGFALLLQKLEIQSSGREAWDHDKVEKLIEEVGLEVFCSRAGIRYEAIATEQDKRRRAADRASGVNKTPPPDESTGGRASRAASPKPKLLRPSDASTGHRPRSLPGASIKPVTLDSDEFEPDESVRNIAPHSAPLNNALSATPLPARPAASPTDTSKARRDLAQGITPTKLGTAPPPTMTEQPGRGGPTTSANGAAGALPMPPSGPKQAEPPKQQHIASKYLEAEMDTHRPDPFS